MSANETASTQRRRPVVPILILILVVPLVYSVVASVFASGEADADPFLVVPRVEETGPCVEERMTMRFRHMDRLKAMRIDAVRYGKRDITFDMCTQCHKSRGEFCDRCHLAVNLVPDCFGCHYYPE